MGLIPYLPEFHPVIAGWWKAHEWEIIPHDALPKTGYIAVNEKREMVCAAWLYRTDSTLAWMEWYISDPLAAKTEVSEGLDLIIQKLSEEAKEAGFQTIFTSMNHAGLIRRMQRHGFTVSDNNVTHLVRVLWAEYQQDC